LKLKEIKLAVYAILEIPSAGRKTKSPTTCRQALAWIRRSPATELLATYPVE